jgi:N,N'-diacetyllegionaminate synthase
MKSKIIKTQYGNISPNSKTYIIAEIAQAHDGSLGMAHSFIDLAKECGADAVKFQTHFADFESSVDDQFRIPFSYKDKNRYDYWKRLEFNEDEWIQLYNHALDVKLDFISTAFSNKAIELLDKFNMPFWKISSGEFYNKSLMNFYLKSNKPLVLSTGLSNDDDIELIVNDLNNIRKEFVLMQCTTKYPTPLKDVGFNYLLELRSKYNCMVGLSDHSGVIAPSIAAIANNVSIIECHLTFDKRMFGPDSTSSLNSSEFKEMSQFASDYFVMTKSEYSKNDISKELNNVKLLFTRSAYFNRDKKLGDVFSIEDVIFMKPGGGLEYDQLVELLGKNYNKNVFKGELVEKSFFL